MTSRSNRSKFADAPRGLVAIALAAATSCGERTQPCVSPTCGSGYECLANTCMPVGSEPVAKDTTRVVLEPASIATTTRSNIGAGAADLGGPGAALSLRFDARWKREGSLVRAFLLLEPAGTEEPDPEDMPLEVWTVEAPWLPARIDGGVLPNLGPPNARGFLRSSPPMTARIDVTRIMLAFAQKRGDDGIAVLAGAVRDHGLGVRTGGAGGAPRLELYVRAQR